MPKPYDSTLTLAVRSQGQIGAVQHMRDLADGVREAVKNSRAVNTRKAYAAVQAQYEAWVEGCRAQGVHMETWPAEPKVVALFAEQLRRDGYARGTIEHRISTLGRLAKLRGQDNPARADIVRLTLDGFRRTMPKFTNQKDPLTADLLLQMLPPLPEDGGLELLSNVQVRDRTILLLGLAAGFRRSEMCALDWNHLKWNHQGVVIHVPRSKTDQTGEGEWVAIRLARDPNLCAVTALTDWRRRVVTRGGDEVLRPITKTGEIRHRRLTPDGLRRIVQSRAQRAGVADEFDIAAHSLRSGMATEMAMRGVPIEKIAEQGRWDSLTTVKRYIRPVIALASAPNVL